MTRKSFMVLFVGLFIGVVSGSVYAEGPGHDDDYLLTNSPMSSGSASTVDSDMWSASGPVETGAVPSGVGKGDPSNERIPADSTFYDSFNPDLRPIDIGGGG